MTATDSTERGTAETMQGAFEPDAPESPDTASAPAPAASAEDVIEVLRQPSLVRQIFGGFGPLVLAAVLVLAMILLAPSVAPERIVERPVDSTGEVEE